MYVYMYLHNDSSSKLLRKTTRNNATNSERLLWSKLRRKQLGGFKFRRNHQILRYYVDFYCPSARLAIEVDGKIHENPQNKLYDQIRDKEIRTLNINILRFSNDDITQNTQQVLEIILKNLTTSPY